MTNRCLRPQNVLGRKGALFYEDGREFRTTLILFPREAALWVGDGSDGSKLAQVGRPSYHTEQSV